MMENSNGVDTEIVGQTMQLTFTSFRDSIDMSGFRVSIDRRAPRLCSYPTLQQLVIPVARNMERPNVERICEAVLDNNWELIQDFINDVYELGISHIILCCWCTKEQIEHGKLCVARIIGDYILDRAGTDGDFKFPIEIEYLDGRETL